GREIDREHHVIGEGQIRRPVEAPRKAAAILATGTRTVELLAEHGVLGPATTVGHGSCREAADVSNIETIQELDRGPVARRIQNIVDRQLKRMGVDGFEREGNVLGDVRGGGRQGGPDKSYARQQARSYGF